MDDLEALEDIEDLEDDIFFSSDDDDLSDHSGGDFIVQRGITLLINIFCRIASSYIYCSASVLFNLNFLFTYH